MITFQEFLKESYNDSKNTAYKFILNVTKSSKMGFPIIDDVEKILRKSLITKDDYIVYRGLANVDDIDVRQTPFIAPEKLIYPNTGQTVIHTTTSFQKAKSYAFGDGNGCGVILEYKVSPNDILFDSRGLDKLKLNLDDDDPLIEYFKGIDEVLILNNKEIQFMEKPKIIRVIGNNRNGN